MPTFKCSFRIDTTITKTFIVANYEVDLSKKDCLDADGRLSKIAIHDSVSDIICNAIDQGDFTPEEDGKLVETDFSNDSPDFITGPTKVE